MKDIYIYISTHSIKYNSNAFSVHMASARKSKRVRAHVIRTYMRICIRIHTRIVHTRNMRL